MGNKQLEVRLGGNKTHQIMGKISPGKERDNRGISKEEAKAEALRIIEEKLKNVEEKRMEEESKEGNNGFVGKKKSHFLSDLKVYVSLIIIFLLAVGAIVVKVYVINPKLGITFSETSNIPDLEQDKQSNQKYTGGGF